ncbi:alpha/beta hydrolase [Sphingoaurantiacus capsulatus]|uniref:Alpha/beta hydrolase n=1 Tax=Sphingoaurantiacus capsulatus TaxID=1771310 RepID=A0ABV7X8K1_9SPHN
MSPPDEEATSLARGNVAPQQRPRGPHPLPAFLQIVAEAVGGDRGRIATVLAGVRAYQAHPYRRDLPAPPTVAQVGSVRLLDYGGSGRPVVFVPSLVNPPSVLDLAPGNSLLRWLAGEGLRPLLVDWGHPGQAERGLSIDGYIDERLQPLLRAVESPAVVGYCLGGTMALAAALREPPERLVLMAVPWNFEGYGEQRQELAGAWCDMAATAEPLGAVPMDLIQPLFWQLDPAGTAAKYERLGRLDPDSDEARAFVALEDWANDGPPLSLPVARQCFEGFYGDNAPGRGAWRGDPASLPCPVLNLVSTRDRIVPAGAAPAVGTRVDIDAGHVGMVVGAKARKLLWEPLRDWLRT